MSTYLNSEDFLPIEPRIFTIKKELEQLLKLVDLESDGRKIEVNGFRLKNLENWRTYKANSAIDALTPLSGRCNCNCVFCFEKKHPFSQNHSILSVEEAKTRLKYYSINGNSLFASNRVFQETFVNPKAIQILKLARKKEPNQIFHFTTNGTFLTKEVIRELSKLKPIILKLSINSIDPKIRKDLMGSNNNSEIVLEAPKYLREFEIPFIGSIVAWPVIMDGDITKTILYLNRYDPYLIRIRLPIFHQYLYVKPPFDTEKLLDKIRETTHRLLSKVTVPLIVEPPYFWVKSIIPEIDGIIKNSPAFESGLKRGDLIQLINNEEVYSRTQAESKLTLLKYSGQQKVELKIKRGRENIHFVLDDSLNDQETKFPYSHNASLPGENYGIYFVEDFHISYINKIIEVIDSYKVKEVLLFSSPIIKPIFESITDTIPEYKSYFQEKKLRIELLENSILGGNCLLIDGRLIDDFIAQIKKFKSNESYIPELILIPAAFGSCWGFDLLGKSYKEIERVFGIPVEIVPWSIIYGKDV